MFRNFLLILLLTLFFGCAHYNGSAIESLSDKNLSANAITLEMCQDFSEAARAALDGEDRAYPLIGKAHEMRKLASGLAQHSAQCKEVLNRIEDEDNPMSLSQQNLILELFKRSWENAKKLAGN